MPLAMLIRRLQDVLAAMRRPRGTDGMTVEASGTAVVEFRDDEDGYTGWVDQNRDGWVLNVGRSLTSSIPLVLHRASCYYMGVAYPNHTTGDYTKVCSTDPADLVAWARRNAEPSTNCYCLA